MSRRTLFGLTEADYRALVAPIERFQGLEEYLIEFLLLRPKKANRPNNCRASASSTRVTGNNAKKAASGSGGSDPDPEPRRQPRLSGLVALRNILTTCHTLIAADTYRPEVLA